MFRKYVQFVDLFLDIKCTNSKIYEVNFRPQGIIRQAKIKDNEIEHLAAVGPILHITKFINKRDIVTQVPHCIGEI